MALIKKRKTGEKSFSSDDLNRINMLKEKGEEMTAKDKYEIAECYSRNENGSADEAESLKWYIEAWNDGKSEALGKILYYAQRGHADAQVIVGECFWEGKFFKQDRKEALKWFKKASARFKETYISRKKEFSAKTSDKKEAPNEPPKEALKLLSRKKKVVAKPGTADESVIKPAEAFEKESLKKQSEMSQLYTPAGSLDDFEIEEPNKGEKSSENCKEAIEEKKIETIAVKRKPEADSKGETGYVKDVFERISFETEGELYELLLEDDNELSLDSFFDVED